MIPLAVDLYCGLGGWAEGFLAEGYDCIGFDIERHDYGTGGYPGQLVIQDVLTLHGSQFKDAAVIVASPPCQAYSYRAMPWKRAKALPPPSNELFDACFRIQREAIAATGSRTCPQCDGDAMSRGCCRCERCDGRGYIYKRYIPLVVENVRGAQRWVGRATWNFGSYYLWGDLPALMPIPGMVQKFNPDGTARPQGSWFKIADSKNRGANSRASVGGDGDRNRRSNLSGAGVKYAISGHAWYRESHGQFSSKSSARKAASAQIAKIPFPLSSWIARCYKPDTQERVA